MNEPRMKLEKTWRIPPQYPTTKIRKEENVNFDVQREIRHEFNVECLKL